MLDEFGVHVLHRVITKKRNKMLPNVRPIVNGGGFSVVIDGPFWNEVGLKFGQLDRKRDRLAALRNSDQVCLVDVVGVMP